MKLTPDEMLPQFQRIAQGLDIGDITLRPWHETKELSKDEIIDLMTDAYHLGHRHGREEKS